MARRRTSAAAYSTCMPTPAATSSIQRTITAVVRARAFSASSSKARDDQARRFAEILAARCAVHRPIATDGKSAADTRVLLGSSYLEVSGKPRKLYGMLLQR